MTIHQTPALFWLLMSISLTGLMFIPYVLRLIIRHSFWGVIADSTSVLVNEAQWALLAKRAHDNAVENLAVLAPLVLLTQMLGLGTALTAAAVQVYFFARLGHAIVYTLAVPVARTVCFLLAWGCQVVIAAQLFGWI